MSRKRERDPSKVYCFKCGRPQERKPETHAVYWCKHCQIAFDDDPNEGIGSHGRKPETRIMRRERYR